jgi:hypothetical protein
MSRLGTRYIALGLGIAAIAAAGCGSSSSTPSATSANKPTTPSPTTTGAAGLPPGLTPSTPIGSPLYKNYLASVLVTRGSGRITSAQASKIAACDVSRLMAKGITTAGAVGSHRDVAQTVGRQCALQVVRGG